MYFEVTPNQKQMKMFFLNNDSTFSEIHNPIFTPALQSGWNDIDVHSLGIVIEHDFLIGLQFLRPDGNRSGGYLRYDKDSGNNDHAYEYNESKWPYPYWHVQVDPSGSGDVGLWMVRADVQPVPEPTTMLLLVPDWPVFGDSGESLGSKSISNSHEKSRDINSPSLYYL
jgi:hypothetical protein